MAVVKELLNMLYVLGDAVDCEPTPIKVLQNMMRRCNVIFILGNHDFMMYTLMKISFESISERKTDCISSFRHPASSRSEVFARSTSAVYITIMRTAAAFFHCRQ